MAEWAETTLGKFVALQRGHDLPSSSRVPGRVPVIGSGGPTGWHNEAKAKGPGIAIGRAANLGTPTLVHNDFWPLNTTLYVTDFRGNDVRFVYNLFKFIDLTGFNSGSVQPMLNRNYIQNFPLVVPAIKEQRSIAAALGALDDKIAANERIASTCGEFVSLRFAIDVWDYDREGDLLEGYSEGRVQDLCEKIGNGGTPNRKDFRYWDGGNIEWYKTGELKDGPLIESLERITNLGLDESPCSLWESGTVLVALYAAPTVGRLGILTHPAAFNQACSGLRAKEIIGELVLFETIKAVRADLQNIAVGAAQQNISKAVLSAHKVVVPSVEAAARFNDTAVPLYQRRVKAMEESRALTVLRDTLLPQLMSGKLRVRDAERIVEDTV